MLPLLLLTLPHVPLSQEHAAPTVAEELAALVEKTNALASFHAIYDVEGHEGDEEMRMTLELVYRAPDLGHVLVSGSRGAFETWIVGNRVYVGRADEWKSGVYEPPAFLAILDERFPRAAGMLDAGVSVSLSLSREASEHGTFQLMFGWMPRRTSVLGWLGNLQAWSGVTAEGSSFRWESEGLRCVVSRATGLLEEVGIAAEGKTLAVRLREGSVDGDLAPESITLPAAARAAAVDAELTRPFTLSPEHRALAFVSVEHDLAAGKRTWDERVRDDWRAVVDAIHRLWIADFDAGLLNKTKQTIEQVCAATREDLGKDASPEHRAGVETHVAELRVGLEKKLVEGRGVYLERLPPIEMPRHAPRRELFDVERVAVIELWDELVVAPLLAAYDEAMSEALKR